MPLANADFIDGDLLEFVQLGLAELSLEVLGLDFLDGVPAEQQMVGDILDGYASGEFEGIAFQGVGVVFLGIGKGDLDLAILATSAAPDAWHLEVNVGRLFADGEGLEGAFDAALGPDVLGAAVGAA